MYIHIYIYTYVYFCIYIYIYVYVYTHTHIFYLHTYITVNLYTYMYLQTDKFESHIYIYMYIYIYTCIHTHAASQRQVLLVGVCETPSTTAKTILQVPAFMLWNRSLFPVSPLFFPVTERFPLCRWICFPLRFSCEQNRILTSPQCVFLVQTTHFYVSPQCVFLVQPHTSMSMYISE